MTPTCPPSSPLLKPDSPVLLLYCLQVYEDGGLVELKDSKLAGVFGYVPQQMFDFDPEWCVGGGLWGVRVRGGGESAGGG